MRSRTHMMIAVAIALLSTFAAATPAAAQTSAADLNVQLTASPTTIVSGNIIAYRATVTNSGPNAATNTQVGVGVRSGLAFVKVTTTKGTCTAPSVGAEGPVFCSIGRLGHLSTNKTATVTVWAKVVALRGAVHGLARVRSAVSDPNDDNNVGRLRTEVEPRSADLSLQMSAPTQTSPGQQLTYTLTATNAGPNAALRTFIVDRLPRGTTFVSATTTQGTCQTPPVGAPGTVRCALGRFGHLDTNNEAIVTIVANLTASAGTITNLAAITSDSPDPHVSNNRAATETDIMNNGVISPTTSADLSVRMTSPNAEPSTDEDLTFIVAVANGGPDRADVVRLTNRLPDGTTFVSATPSQGTCTAPPVGRRGTVECAFGNLDVRKGASLALVVHVSAAPGTLLTNTATVTHGLLQTDPTPLDEMVTVKKRLALVRESPPHLQSPTADVALEKSLKEKDGKLYELLKVKNDGPGFADDVKVAMDFAPGAEPPVSDIEPTQGTCAESSSGDKRTVCSTGPLPPGASAEFAIPIVIDTATIEPIRLPWSALGHVAAEQETSATSPQPPLDAVSTANITSVNGAFDLDAQNNFLALLMDRQPTTLAAMVEDKSSCGTLPIGPLALVLRITCDSPSSDVEAWRTATESPFLAGSMALLPGNMALFAPTMQQSAIAWGATPW